MAVTCPNKNLKEWKTLVNSVGEFEAYRDYLNTGGLIRSPQEVLSAIEQRNPLTQKPDGMFNENPTLAEVFEKTFDEQSLELNTEEFSRGRALETANKMSTALGVDYELITPEQAVEISDNKWTNEGAFFYKGKVYFLKDRLSSSMVFHEMSHPFVRAISKQNPELFDKLYNDLLQTEEGRSVRDYVRRKYPEYDTASDIFKEEIIVRALTEAGMKMQNQETTTGGFKNFIKELLFQLKQFARKIFGREISISKLSPLTTIDELATILSNGDKINIDIEILTNDDLIAFNRELKEQATLEVDEIKYRDLQANIDKFYDTTKKHMNQLYRNRNFEELARLLYDDFGRSDIAEMRANLASWQTKIEKDMSKFEEELADTTNRSRSFVDTIFRLEEVIQKVYDHISDIETAEDTIDNANKAHYYGQFLEHYLELVNDFKETLVNNEVGSRATITGVITDIENNIKRAQKKLDNFYFNGARDTLWDQYKEIGATMEEMFRNSLKKMTETNAPQSARDALYKEYHGMTEAEYGRYKNLSKKKETTGITNAEQDVLSNLIVKSKDGLVVTKDKIEALLKGQAGDANWFNSNLEGYMYNTDPIVGGLALYTKNALNEVMIVTAKKANAFAEKIKPLAEAAGVNYAQLGKLGADIGFRDIVAKYNAETGEMEKREVWTFLNEFKDYRYDADVLRKAKDDAYQQYLIDNTDESRAAYLKAKADEQEFQRKYMHSEYVEEYYQVRELFTKDEIGREAGERREEIFNEIRKLTESVRNQTDELEISDELDLLWREYKQLTSRYDLNGKLKTGKEAQIAERLRQYRDESRKFYEDVPRKRAFEKAYFNFLEELRARPGMVEKSKEWYAAIDKWKRVNTTSSPTQAYYDQMNNITSQIEDLLSKVPTSDKNRQLQEKRLDLYRERQEIVAGFRDDTGQPIAPELSSPSLKRLAEIDQELNDIKDQEITASGLTKQEKKELRALFELRDDGTMTNAQSNRMNELLAKRGKGLDKNDIQALQMLYRLLEQLSERKPTTYYLDIFNNLISKVNNLKPLANALGTTTITEDNIDLLFDETIGGSALRHLKRESAEFKQWFEANHLESSYEYFDKESGENVTVNKITASYAWTYSSPKDKAQYMEKYDITDENGNVVDTVYGKPKQKYYDRKIKSKYTTQKVVGKTVDNTYQWLPKSRQEMENSSLSETEKYKYINDEYFRLRETNKPLFDLLEALKQEHLANQEGLSVTSKLYLDFPRMRKSKLEVARSLNLIKKGKESVNAVTYFSQRVKEFFERRGDDGLNEDQKFKLVRTDLFDNEITNVPIAGLYDIDANDVSTDITTTMMRYMFSAERQKQLVKMSPIVRSLQKTVNNPDNAMDDLTKVSANDLKNRNVFRFLKKKENVRAAAVNNWIAKHFEGQSQAGITKDIPWLNNFSNLLFKQASFSFFAFNIPSDLKNSLGMKFQQMIEAAGGQHVDFKSLQKGNAWSYKAMAELSFGGQLYTKSAKSHMQQMIQVFDPEQGRFEDTIGESVSRTPIKDVASMSWMFSFRQWVQRQATIQLWAGIMYKQKVQRTMPDGSVVEIPYMDAFETINGVLQLKSGIDVRYGNGSVNHVVSPTDTLQSIAKQYNIPVEDIEEVFSGVDLEEIRYQVELLEQDKQAKIDGVNLDGAEDALDRNKRLSIIQAIERDYNNRIADKGSIKITNSKFNRTKNLSHQVINDMGGAYASFDQPEAQRYLAFRFISFIRRYFTTMAVRRWGFSGPLWNPRKRFNPGTGQGEMGFYIEFAKFMTDLVRYKGKNLAWMKPSEKAAVYKMLTEGVMLYLSTALLGLLFGWDPDDEDRYAKLREKSGALPFLGLTESAEDTGREFDLMGYLELHTLHMMMQVRGENEQFNPLFGGVSGYTSLLDLKSIALGPTTDTYQRIITDLSRLVDGDPKAYYTRRVGAYEWQQKEEAKIKNRIAKMVGLTGKTLDPADAIQGFQSWQSIVKK
jgi:hypothetical protein